MTRITDTASGQSVEATEETIELCPCCTMALANDDITACRDYYGHTHNPLSGLDDKRYAIIGTKYYNDTTCWTCDGCNDTYDRLDIDVTFAEPVG